MAGDLEQQLSNFQPQHPFKIIEGLQRAFVYVSDEHQYFFKNENSEHFEILLLI